VKCGAAAPQTATKVGALLSRCGEACENTRRAEGHQSQEQPQEASPLVERSTSFGLV
jgi:hypothetical protein